MKKQGMVPILCPTFDGASEPSTPGVYDALMPRPCDLFYHAAVHDAAWNMGPSLLTNKSACSMDCWQHISFMQSCLIQHRESDVSCWHQATHAISEEHEFIWIGGPRTGGGVPFLQAVLSLSKQSAVRKLLQVSSMVCSQAGLPQQMGHTVFAKLIQVEAWVEVKPLNDDWLPVPDALRETHMSSESHLAGAYKLRPLF